MTTKDEALKLALEAMEGACGSYNVPLTAQNFWAQIAVDITARRKMSARVMPNL